MKRLPYLSNEAATASAELSRRSFLKSTAALGAALSCGLVPGTLHAFDPRSVHGGIYKEGDLEVSLKLLNLFTQKSEEVNALYSAIYNALEQDKQATFEVVSKDREVQRLCAELKLNHLGGPILGDLKPDGVSIWMRTLNPAKVQVRVTVNGQVKEFGPVMSSFESDLTAVVKVSGLPAGASFSYQVLVDGKEVAIPEHATITTPPAREADPTRIVFGTCQHRWGLGNELMAKQILERQPHAFLNYGDIAVQDRHDNFNMQRADYALRDFHPAYRDIVSSIPVYTSWDDHDYAKNDGWGLPGLGGEAGRQGTRKVFIQAWNNPYNGLGDEGGGIFHHSRVGPCDIIMTDNRYFRKAEGKHCYFGPEQMAWLKSTLLACKGQFIIMSSGTMWFDYVSNGKDGIGLFDPQARDEIFDLIEEHNIPGVLLISGDRHGARVFKTTRASGCEFYEFEPASLGGRKGPPAVVAGCKEQLFGKSRVYAFGEFTFDVSKEDPEVTFRLISETSKVLYELTLKRSQLTPSK